MRKPLVLLMSCVFTLLLTAGSMIQARTRFNPHIWDDGGNQWISDSLKWNINRIKVEFTKWRQDAMDKLNDRWKEESNKILNKINEIDSWLKDKKPAQRLEWQGEYFAKIRVLGQLFGCGIHDEHSLSTAQIDKFRKISSLANHIDYANSDDSGLVGNLLRISK
jgi:hypothetical protein